jgi:hypothetical protein
MAITSDKDIGRIWKRLNEDCQKGEDCRRHGDEFRLIRSLVMERARHIAIGYYRVNEVDPEMVKSCHAAALRDFGIDRQSWENGG